MTPTEAYYFTLEKIHELKNDGIEVKFKESNQKNDPKIVKKFQEPQRVSPELWMHVTFTVKDKNDSQKITNMANYLGMCGISFDSGGGCGVRDWELDWSFKYKKGNENWEWRENREVVEDIIDSMDKSGDCEYTEEEN